jgi:hypothetical protein
MLPSSAMAQIDANGWTLTNPTLVGPVLGTEGAAPATPAAGKVVLYPKSGAPGEWCSKDDAGVETCMSAGGGGGSATALLQGSGSDFRYAATEDAYYYDVDGDGVRDTDGTENFVDLLSIEVPRDYDTVQEALDSNHCKKGNTANTGCRIVVAPGVYAQSFEIGGSLTTDFQYSVAVEGIGPAGFENSLGTQTCGATFTGDNTFENTVVRVAGSIGWAIRNICIDMDEAATNDPKYGIEVGYAAVITKNGFVENVTIEDGTVSGGAGILIGNGASSDTAFNVFRDIRMENVQTCLIQDSTQAVDNFIYNLSCSNPLATIGGLDFRRGEIGIDGFYMSSGASGQTGIEIDGITIPMKLERLTFEWDEPNGKYINFDSSTNLGNYRTVTISHSRFQPLTVSSHVCIDWSRAGTLHLIGNSFESSSDGTGIGAQDTRRCEIELNNPHGTRTSDVYWTANDVQWNATQDDMVVTRTTSGGGALRVMAIDDGEVAHCNGAGSGITATSTGCYGTGITGPLGSWDFANALTGADIDESTLVGVGGAGYAEIAAAAYAGF